MSQSPNPFHCHPLDQISATPDYNNHHKNNDRHALHEHLGGAGAYQMFQSEVAPATLLYGSIALTVFARAADVASGAFAAVGAETSAVRNGVNLVVGKAGNKGMTGLSFRYHDATLAFVTCHYASDSAGKKRLRQRNLDAHRTLREIRLTDDEGFHVAAQHHHTVRLGVACLMRSTLA